MSGRPTLRTVLGWSVAVVVLVGVFSLYAQPSVMVFLADMMWSCFN